MPDETQNPEVMLSPMECGSCGMVIEKAELDKHVVCTEEPCLSGHPDNQTPGEYEQVCPECKVREAEFDPWIPEYDRTAKATKG